MNAQARMAAHDDAVERCQTGSLHLGQTIWWPADNMDLEPAQSPAGFFTTLARDLKAIAVSNIQYFQDGKHSHHARFHAAFSLLYEYLETSIEPAYGRLSQHLSLYDFSAQVPGNGYRSLLHVVLKCCLHLLQLSRYISSVRDSILFRKKFYAKELESYVSALGQMRAVLYYALKLTRHCRDGQLFIDETHLGSDVAERLVLEVESLSQESFYGRCLGFQFCQSMQRPLQVLAIAMASYSEGYLEPSQVMQVATSVFNSGKYILDPDLRAQQMVKVTRTADIQFCKAFWSFSESPLMHQLPSFVCPSVEVNEVITLGPDSFELPLLAGGDTVLITPPCAHTGPGHVYTRLISAHLRDGQHLLRKSGKLKTPTSTKPKASGLIIHIHGGGFVAQSSKSHEVYLREWAVSTDVPILSVDYSLAPEWPFPRALEECFYAFAWAVDNCAQLGSTGEQIILVGDSAGGNLVISTAMRAVSFGIRAPDGILAIYPCTVVRYTPSPARLLSLMDPVLPFGLITKCLAAYAGINEQQPMATPRMDDVHSERSLTSIQLKSYEVVDNDWIMIAQGEEEVNPIQSPDSSPLDGISGSKNLQHAATNPDDTTDDRHTLPDPACKTMEQSATPDSDQEIFVRLECDGSVAFPGVRLECDGSVAFPGVRLECDGSVAFPGGLERLGSAAPGLGQVATTQEQNANVNRSELRGKSGSDRPSQPKLAQLGMLQEQARRVVQGAHSMFSKMSSYIPSTRDVSTQSVISSLSSLLPTSYTTALEPTVDTTASQQPAGQAASQQPAGQAASQQPADIATSKQAEVVPDAADESSTQDVASLSKHSVGTCQTDTGLLRSPDDTEISSDFLGSHSACVLNVTMNRLLSDTGDEQSVPEHRRHVTDRLSREAVPTNLVSDAEFSSPLDEISVDSDVAMATSSSFHTTSSSQAFDTAYSSPFSPSLPGSISLDNCEPISPSSESSTSHGYLSTTSMAGTDPMLPSVCDHEDILPSVCDHEDILPSVCEHEDIPSVWKVVDGDCHVHSDTNSGLVTSNSNMQTPNSITETLPGSDSTTETLPGRTADVHLAAGSDTLIADHDSAFDTLRHSHANSENHCVSNVCEDSNHVSLKLGVEDSGWLSETADTDHCHLSLACVTVDEDKHEDKHSVLETWSPDKDVATFCVDDLNSGPLSPRMLPALPEEKKHLLEDALESWDVSPELNMQAEHTHLTDIDHRLDTVWPGCEAAAVVSHEMRAGDSTGHRLNDGSDNTDIDNNHTDHGHHVNSNTDTEKDGIHERNDNTDTEKDGIHERNDNMSRLAVNAEAPDDHKMKVAPFSSMDQEGNVQTLRDKHSKPTKPTSLKLKKTIRPHLPGFRALSPRCRGEHIDCLPSVSQRASQGPTPTQQTLLSARQESRSSLPSSPATSRSDGFLRHGSLPTLASLLSPRTKQAHARKASSTTSCHHDLKTDRSASECAQQDSMCHSPLHRLRTAAVVNNPYMSPLLAPDELLRGLPLVSIVACHLDPLLDDSVMFSRRLRDLQVPVSLHLIDDLPHGFLNFALLSVEARQAASLCGRKLSQMLQGSHV